VVVTSPAAGAEELTPVPLVISAGTIEAAVATAEPHNRPQPRLFAAPRQGATSGSSTARRVIWTAIGGAGGFFGGAYLGSAIENAVAPCGCDDPGFKGALIGMPIGAIAGGIAGYLLSK